MKRTIKIAAVAFIAAMGILVAYNATSDTEMNDLQNENLEALAGDINPECPNGCVRGTETCKCYGEHKNTREGIWKKQKTNF